ncbi:MAG: HD domain-containing phosphohydrolase [Bermanella sp.]
MSESTLSAKILIVDDKPVNVDLLETMLMMTGFSNVNSTTDSREVEAMHDKDDYDLILLDIRMPYMDGFEVMEALSKKVSDDYLPVLVLTAQQDMETRMRALELGAIDYITKPFDSNEVLNRINNILLVRRVFNVRKDQAQILEEMVQNRTAQLQQRTLELEKTRYAIIRCLGRAGEYRDNETGFHVIRMSKSSQVLALAAGLGEKKAELILNASPMHDIGKIGIPDQILLKPGKLEKDEWEVMQTHVAIGGEILREDDSELMGMAHSIAMSHHEKFDGSGYPQGLKGEDIPIEGRISAICDVFDALTSERPYKQAWSVEDAVAFIIDGSGSHFDPNLVAVFNRVLPQILKIRVEYSD